MTRGSLHIKKRTLHVHGRETPMIEIQSTLNYEIPKVKRVHLLLGRIMYMYIIIDILNVREQNPLLYVNSSHLTNVKFINRMHTVL